MKGRVPEESPLEKGTEAALAVVVEGGNEEELEATIEAADEVDDRLKIGS